MLLTKKQIQKIYKHIGEKQLASLQCPICYTILKASTKWKPGKHLYQISQYDPDDKEDPRVIIPVVIYMCENCGYMLFFNAIQMGIVEADK